MPSDLSDEDLSSIRDRLRAALRVVTGPWVPHLETRASIGGGTFIQRGDTDRDEEIYVTLALRGSRVDSPDERLDAVVDFLGHAADDVEKLVAEVTRHRGR